MEGNARALSMTTLFLHLKLATVNDWYILKARVEFGKV